MKNQAKQARNLGGRPRKTPAQKAADAAARQAALPPPMPLSASYYVIPQMLKLMQCSRTTWDRMQQQGIGPKTTLITPYKRVVLHADYEQWLANGGVEGQRKRIEAEASTEAG